MTSQIRPRRTGTRWPLIVPTAVAARKESGAEAPVILVDLRDWGEFRRGRRLERQAGPDAEGRVCWIERITQ